MESLLTLLLSGDTSTTMLLLFILGLLTKRIVPWYVHEEVVEKLKKYEEQAPEMVEQMELVIKLLEREEKLREAIEKKPTVNPRTLSKKRIIPQKKTAEERRNT